jgi:hypothetical protein
MTLRALACFAAALMLAACTANAPPPKASPAINSGDPVACGAAGGTIRPVCRLQRPMCVIPYADAGKACTDDSQCQGGCLYEGAAVAANGTTTGLCRKDNDPCGCIEHLKDGKRVSGVCVD